MTEVKASCPFRPRRKGREASASGVCTGKRGATGLRRGDSRIAPTFVWFGYSPPVTAVISNSV